MKQTLIWFLQRDGTGNWFSNIKNTFTENLQLQMSVLHKGMCIFKLAMLISQGVKLTDGWTKYKGKVPDGSYSYQNVEKNAIPNSSLQSLKIHSSTGCRKTR